MPKSLAQLVADAKAEGWSEWIKSEADERAVLDGYWFDVAAGEHWCNFLEKWFVFTRGEDLDGESLVGKPYSLVPYQRTDILMPLFGWKRDRQRPHLRRYQKGDVFIGKKQAKSTLCGALCDAWLLKGPPRTEVYGVAHTRDQASVIYREAAAFASKSPEPSKRLKPLDTVKRIIYRERGSFYQVLAGENGARAAEGIIPSLIVFDEIHVQRDRVLYDALAYACLAIENSLFLSVSTVGVADQTTIWWEQYEYCKGLLSGKITDHARFAYICQADEGCKDSAEMRADPEQWRKALPALGITVKEEKVRDAVREAENSPKKLNNLLRYIFNIPTAQIERVIPMDKWDACQGELPDLTGRECIAGLDVASREDLTALVLYFLPVGEEKKGYLLSFFWCPAEKIRQREMKAMAFYSQWVNDGHLLMTPGNSIDHPTILAKIRECCQKYRVRELYFDTWNSDAIVNPLEYDDLPCIAVPQTMAGMSAFTSSFLDAISEEELIHDGNPVMTWCCSNVAADTLHDAIKFNKQKSADKIDGAVAAAMAVGRGRTGPAEASYPELIVL